jgi:nitrite reductase/ring-hydroxylating ferredoxin subunit/uncharacterized membrane protein
MDTNKISDWITHKDAIDRFAKPVQDAIAKVYKGDEDLTGKGEQFLHGRWLGHPLHSLLVHIPVGAWTLAAILDLFGSNVGARAGADWAIGIGLIVAIPAILTGLTDWYPYGDTSVRRIGFVHMTANIFAFILYAISFASRGGDGRFVALSAGYVGFACLILSGYLGGLMVYDKRVGVNHAVAPEPEEAPEEFASVMKLGELENNKPTKVQVGDVFAVLVKTEGRVFAMAEKCSHEGGPLSEGTVVDGCLECPWHATCFRLEDGQVESGPGVFAQPVFEVYIKSDEIMVKAARVENPLIASTPVPAQIFLL